MPRGQKKVLYLLELELQVGFEPSNVDATNQTGFSAKAAGIPNHGAISSTVKNSVVLFCVTAHHGTHVNVSGQLARIVSLPTVCSNGI